MLSFYPGDQAAFHLARFLVMICLTCGVGLLASLAWRRNYSARHSVLLSTLLCCLFLPGIAMVFWGSDISLVSLPWLPAETPVAHSESIDGPRESRFDSLSSPIVESRPQDAVLSPRTQAEESNTSGKVTSSPPFVLPQPATVLAATATRTPSAWRPVAAMAILVWLIGSAVLLARVAWSSVRLVRLAQSATDWPRKRLGRIAGRLEMSLGQGKLPRICLSELVSGPLAFGIFRKTILVPARMLGQLSEDQLADVLMHEAAHLARRDPLVLLLQRIAASLYWPIPLVHFVNRLLHQMREELCDNHVLAHRDAVHYGETLLRVAELVCFAPPVRGANTMLARPGRLETRIKNLLDVRRNKMTTLSRGLSFFAFGLVLAAGVLACGIQIVSAQADTPAGGKKSKPDAAADDPKASHSYLYKVKKSISDETDPAKNGSHREVFKPLHGMENQSSWTALADFPREDKKPYEQMIARLTLQGEIPVQRKADKEPLFKIKLMAGSEDSLNVRLTGPDKMPYDRILHRDQSLAWKIKGQTYRIVYPTTEVAADQPAETHFAFVFVTCRPDQKDDQETLPPEESTDNSKGDGGSDLLRNLRASTAPILKDMAEKAGYGLGDGEFVRHVPLPYSELRTTYYRVGHPHQSDAIPSPPTHMLFHWSEGQLKNWGMSFGGPPESGQSVGSIVSSVTDFESQEIEGDAELLEKRIAGDWVVRTGEKPEKLLPELEAILRKELSLPVRLELKTVEREVYVASGNYKLTPLEGQEAQGQLHLTDKTITTDRVQIFGKALVPDSGAGGGTGDLDEFLKSLGQWIGVPIVKEVEQGPVREISYKYHQRSPFTDQMQKEDRDAETVLRNITKQTNLKFTKQKRPVTILFVTRER
jgi:beta-lactamase regulating signal transducer with metallopeptidase domain